METRKEKLDFIKAHGIPVFDDEVNIDELVRFARIKKMIKDRLNGGVECFGTLSYEDSACNECFLHANGECCKYTEYLQTYKDKLAAVPEKEEPKVEPKPVGLVSLLSKMKFRKNSAAYRICHLLLSSSGKEFDSVLDDIIKIIGLSGDAIKDMKKANVRFYQAKKALRDKLGIEIDFEVKKIMKVENGTESN